jgi:hypothetical protein
MPRAEELVGASACPVCEYAGPAELPPEPAAAPAADPEPVAAAGGGAGAGLALGLAMFVAGGLAGAGGLLIWQGVSKPDQKQVEPPVVADAAPAKTTPVAVPVSPAPATPQPAAVTPAPATATQPEAVPLPAALPVAEPPRPQPQPQPPQVEPLPQPVPPKDAAPPNPFRPAAPLVVAVNNPDGEVTMVVEPGRSRKVRGKVRVLKVPGLEAGAQLDCSDLEADEVVVGGKIDGGSRLWVKAPNGRVTFLGRIDGRSHVEVRAPGGQVNFAPPGTKVEGCRIDGGATVEVLAKAVGLHSRVHGDGTRVTALLTEGGSLLFTEIGGPARLEYRRFDPDDPHPAVTHGSVGPGARVVKLKDPDDD